MNLTEFLEFVESIRSYPSDTRWCAMRLYAIAYGVDLGMLAHLAATYEESGQWQN